ncbi:MAG: carboxymuconolactone decarboxylase family protein [Planctomycetes bacterium]|nr:carboxymuconolactone decarboxylase family protein [Planctomycetota bacterium]
MPRLPLIQNETSPSRAQELLAGVQKKLGLVPNMARVLANSPAALEAYLAFSGALATGTLTAAVREELALVIGEVHGCGYCLSAHTAIGKRVGLKEDQILDARRGRSKDLKTNALLVLARTIALKRGELADADLRAARDAGVTDAEIVEVVGAVALNVYTNWLNHVAATPIDFPDVKPGVPAADTHAASCATGACGA